MASGTLEAVRAGVSEEEIAGLCSQLIRFESVNPPGDDREIAEFVASLLRDAGLAVDLLCHTPTRASVLARLPGSGEVPALLYSGHLDVVPVGAEGWLRDPFGGEVADGRVWGRGASDMKGGLAAIMSAAGLLAAAELPLRGDLILALTAGEENTQFGAAAISERLRQTAVQAAVVAEPNSNAVQIAEKGLMWLRLTTSGKTAHGSTPDLGENAIVMMVTLLKELESLAPLEQRHPSLGGFTQNVGTISGGVKTNVVPDECEATFDLRTLPGQEQAAILKYIEELVGDLKQRVPGFRASVEVVNRFSAVTTAPDEPVVTRFCDVVAEVTGTRPLPGGAKYATDAATLIPVLGSPMIICGPGSADLAHQPNEYVDTDKMVEAAEILDLAATRLLT